MAHWAQVDENNIVVQVLVTENNGDDDGYNWLVENIGGRWIQTSYNTQGGVHVAGGTPIRYNFAGEGFFYDEEADAFYSPQPYPSWVLNTDTYVWEAPTPRPAPFGWVWNEEAVQWEETEQGDWPWPE